MPEMTENQTPLCRTHRKKNRETHNAVERHRKKKINSGINKIGELIPCSPALKQSKNMILDQASKYISELKRQNDEILLNGGAKEQGEEIVRLRKQLNELQKENDRFAELLKANDICLHDDPTIHWKRKLKGTKVTMVVSSNQMQDDILVYTNGNQLNGNCQQPAGHSSPEQALNTLSSDTPETCFDLMVPVAMSDISQLANGAQLQTPISQQEDPECLPTTSPSLKGVQCPTITSSSTVHSVLNVSTKSSGQVVLQCPLSSCASASLACPTSTSAQIVLERSMGKLAQCVLETASERPTQSVLDITTSTCFALPLRSQQFGTPCTGMESPSGMTPQSVLGLSSVIGQSPELRSTSFSNTECSQNMLVSNDCQNVPVSIGGLFITTASFKLGAMSNGDVMSSCPIANSWAVCPASTYTGTSDSNSVSTFSRMSSAGNTQTTWTTLQLAGNTVHPVSQGGSNIMPVPLNGNLGARNTFSISESGQPFNNVTVVPSASTAFQGVSFCSAYRQLKQQVAVTVQAPLQPLPLQPVLAQPQIPAQPAAKVVSLLPPLQVIQMARSAGSSVSSTPNNQNLIILQPANPTSPAVVRGALTSQGPGQQIVIIQAASQNAVSVVPAQTSNRLPALDSNQLVCSSSNTQSTSSVQTVGGKHLVHILPRPISSSPCTSSQSFTSTGSGQQQQTISVNGQLFALQPVKQSGASSQNTMQIIQPTTSADPNTNVALNTFGALTNLSQNISQMAGQGGLQLTSSHAANPSAPTNGQNIGASTSSSEATVTSTSTDTSTASTWHTSSSCPLKSPLGPSSSCKTKKMQKKSLSAKQGATRKATCTGNKTKVDANCVEHTKSNKDNPLQSLTSGDQVLSSQGLTISQQSSLPQTPTLVAATVTTSVTSQEGVARQQSAPRLSQHVLPSCSTEPAVAESVSREQTDILAVISATSALVASLPPSSSRGDLMKNVLSVPSPPCVITEVSTSVTPASPYCSNAALQGSGAFSIDKDSDLVELQTAVANVCNTPGISSVSAQLESLTVAQHQGNAGNKERTQDWYKGQLEMDKFAATKEIRTQDGSSMMQVVPHGDRGSSNEKGSLLSFVKVSCADNELCVDSSRETSTGMLFYEKGEPQKDILLVSTEAEGGVQQQLCNPDQESMGGPLIVHRQTESPMSSSSGSSRGFSVASMLPDSTRDDASCISTMTSTFNNYSLSEQNDIVALAARAIFEHGSPGKSLASDVTVCDVRSKAQKIPFAAKEYPSQPSVKALGVKEQSPNLTEARAAEDQTQQTLLMDTSSRGTSVNKTSTSVVKEIPNMPLICPSSVSATLSVINHACHSEAIQMQACSQGQTQLGEQLPVCATADLSSAPSTYTEQSSQATLLTEFSHEQLDTRKGNSQTSLVLEPLLKQSSESRKDATKRTGPDDQLISTAKRQKQCQNAAVRLGGKSTVSPVPECGQTFIGQLPTNSSSLLVSGSNPVHTDSLSTLFPPTNFLISNSAETLRPSEAHCNAQPQIQEREGQQGSQQLQQHLMSQQTVSSQAGLNVHHGHMYYKHHQGQIRERHLYHLQHHLPHNESSVHPQAHSVQQPRAVQQEIQMQKKRGLMRGSQTPQMSLQQKQQPSGNGQGRQKGNHQHHHHQHHHHQQQLQQQMPHSQFGNSQQDKRCDNSVINRNHHSSHTQSLHSQDLLHQHQQDNARSGQQGAGGPPEQSGQSRIQRLMTSRSLDQQMASKSNSGSRPSEIPFTSHRQERNRISTYSAEALIRKAPSNVESRMGMTMQSTRNNLEQTEMRTYLDLSMNKNLPVHSLQAKLSLDHCINSDVQGLPDCPPFKVSVTTQGVGTFEVQSSRGNEMVNSMPTHRGMQSHGFRLGQGPGAERQARLPYLPMQGISSGSGVPLRENEGSCHQSFMKSLLAPPLSEQIGANQRSVPEHPRNTQCVPPASIEYSCPSVREGVHIRRDGEVQNRESCDMSLGALGSRNNSLGIYTNPSSIADSQGRNTSPNVSAQKNSLRMNEGQGNKCHPSSQASPNVHGAVRPVMPHTAVSHSGNEQGHTIQQPSSSGISQRGRHPVQEGSASKMRQTDRSRSGNHRNGNVFEHGLQLPLASSSSMILGRQQPVSARAGSIVRFMTEGQQLPNDNLTPDHSLSQNFGFPFIPESGMNPPINANPSFIPPVTQPGANRTPALIPVEPQNPLSSFYPPYSPAHPNLSNDLSIPYFSNPIFSSPNTEKANAGGLNNPFGSILSPPRPVGFPQPNFPLLPDMPARPMANTSSITPHLSNFNLTTLFPEIAAAPLATESTAMPMSPLLPLTNPALSDVSKQHSNRSAHNISHILGHDGSSAV